MSSYKTLRVALATFFLASIWGGCSDVYHMKRFASQSEKEVVLIQDVNVFVGEDAQLLKHQSVWISNGVILSVSRFEHDTINLKPDTIIQGAGKYLMPGLVDTHVHLSGNGAVPWKKVKPDVAYNLEAYLSAGITTVYDLGGLSKSLEKWQQKVLEGNVIGPTIYHTHIPISPPGGHPIPLTQQMVSFPLKGLIEKLSPTIDAAEEAGKLLDQYVKQDIDYVKVICDAIPPGTPEMSGDVLAAVVSASHARGYKVFAHIGSPQNAIDAVRAGADVLAHGVWRGKLTDDQAKEIAASKIPIIYTVSGFQNVAHIHHGEFQPSELDKHWVPSEVLDPVTGEQGTTVHDQETMNDFFKDAAQNAEHWLHNFQALYQHGAVIMVGTDSSLPGTYAGSTYHQEMELLSEMGMYNIDILLGATSRAAALLGAESGFGKVKAGLRAELLLLNDNPLSNLTTLQQPTCILHQGKILVPQPIAVN